MKQVMRIVLVEDETIIAEYLKNVIEGKGHEVKVLLTGNIDFSEFFSENDPDLVFLDIHLNSKQTGVDFAKICQERSVPFVYLTSYSDSKTINSAFEYDPIAYILKPFTEEEVYKTLEIAKIKIAQGNQNRFLSLKDGYDTVRVKYMDIRWLKADNIYTEISTDSKKYLQRIPLSEMMDMLPGNQFCRVHRSFIVNLERVDRVGSDHLEVAGEQIPLSRTKKTEILDRLNLG